MEQGTLVLNQPKTRIMVNKARHFFSCSSNPKAKTLFLASRFWFSSRFRLHGFSRFGRRLHDAGQSFGGHRRYGTDLYTIPGIYQHFTTRIYAILPE